MAHRTRCKPCSRGNGWPADAGGHGSGDDWRGHRGDRTAQGLRVGRGGGESRSGPPQELSLIHI
eukprot:15420995-Alexandrium_andersonii.AAC.1